MKSLNLTQLSLFLFMILTFTGCDLAVGIFEAGMWVGIIVVVLVIILIIWLIRKIM